MNSARRGYDLFRKIGWINFFNMGGFRSKQVRDCWFGDTFGKYICKLFGHGETFVADNAWVYCKRCSQMYSGRTLRISLEEIGKSNLSSDEKNSKSGGKL